MFNLLSAECYKLKKSRNLYVCCIVVVFLLVFIFGMLILADHILSGEIDNGTGGVYVSQEAGAAAAEAGFFMGQFDVMVVLQQLFAGDFMPILLAIFTAILVVEEYKSGAVKNIVGKGYARGAIFLSKFVSVSFGVFLLLLVGTAADLLAGAVILGQSAFYPGVFGDMGIYFVLQFIMCIALCAVFVLISEIGRNIAAAISAGICVAVFSGLLAEGLDMLFTGSEVRPSEFWLINMSWNCPLGGFETEFIVKTILISVFWTAAALVAGYLHFKKADVK